MVFGTVSGPIFLFSEFCFSIHFKWNNRKQKNIKYYERIKFWGEHCMDKVKNRLNPPPIYVRARMSIFEAVKRMKKHEVSAILVIEGKNYVGVFTEAD